MLEGAAGNSAAALQHTAHAPERMARGIRDAEPCRLAGNDGQGCDEPSRPLRTFGGNKRREERERERDGEVGMQGIAQAYFFGLSQAPGRPVSLQACHEGRQKPGRLYRKGGHRSSTSTNPAAGLRRVSAWNTYGETDWHRHCSSGLQLKHSAVFDASMAIAPTLAEHGPFHGVRSSCGYLMQLQQTNSSSSRVLLYPGLPLVCTDCVSQTVERG